MMKKLKRMLALLAAFALVLAMAVPAWAASASPTKTEDQGTGTITIENAKNGETYSIYRIFDLTSYVPSTTTGEEAKASYKVTTAWKTFIQSQTKYIALDDKDQPTWVSGADVSEFAKAALTWAKKTNVTAQATVTAANDEAKFTNLKDGYYLIDTTTGTLCSLKTATNDITVKDKNDVPEVDKKVEKNPGDGDWDDENTAQIGSTVSYRTTIKVKDGAKGYVLHDKMDEGLTLNAGSITVKVGTNPIAASADTYTVTTSELEDKCTFEITFADAYVASLDNNTEIVVNYSATLNEKAKIASDTNKNETWLKYGDKSTTTHDTAETKTFSFDLVKTDNFNKLLAGAQFELYTDENCTAKVDLVKDGEDYRVASATEKAAANFTSAVILSNTTSKITVKGLKGGTSYWLKEIKAPDGYNELEKPFGFTMSADNNMNATLEDIQWKNGGVHIINNAGTTLPSTGGMGTTIFYVVGGGLMAVAVVLLVTKKRMENKR